MFMREVSPPHPAGDATAEQLESLDAADACCACVFVLETQVCFCSDFQVRDKQNLKVNSVFSVDSLSTQQPARDIESLR